jgi:transcriptional regulator with XRE-family HTH domain
MSEASVYVFGAGDGLVKIGVSKDTATRAAQLRLLLAGGRMIYERATDPIRSRKAERLAHTMLAAHRIGGEWFAIDPDAAIMAVDGAIDAAVIPAPRQIPRRVADRPMTWAKIGRIAMGWSLKDLSERAAVSRPTISRLEAGSDDVTCGTVDKVLMAFLNAGCTMEQTVPGVMSRGIMMRSPPESRMITEWEFSLSYGKAKRPGVRLRSLSKGGE